MIVPLLGRLERRVSRADVVVKGDDTLTLTIAPDGSSRTWGCRSRIAHLRVIREGRIGYATGGEDRGPDELAERALRAAASGAELELFLPLPAPLPELALRAPQAGSADVAALEGIARTLLERLRHGSRRVEVWAERSSGSVQVGNTRGVLAGYEVTLAGAGAVVESIGAGYAPPCRVHTAGVGLPGLPELEALVAEVDRRLGPPLQSRGRPLPRALPVCLGPRAVATLLAPLRAGLAGQPAYLGNSPLRGRLGERLFDRRLSLSDDPLAPGRPGSRPIDDDGVVARRVMLIERGRLVGFLADLETGSRAGVPSTGHGWRRTGGGSRVGFSNLRVTPGVETRATLLTMMGRGLLVEDLEWGAGANPIRGTLSVSAPWTYLVENGAVTGRLEGVRLSGNVFEALNRIGAVGGDATWVGAVSAPTILLEGLMVSANRA